MLGVLILAMIGMPPSPLFFIKLLVLFYMFRWSYIGLVMVSLIMLLSVLMVVMYARFFINLYLHSVELKSD